MAIEDLFFNTASAAFIGTLKLSLQGLPSIGDPSPTDNLFLAHYSTNSSITKFYNDTKSSWTNAVSDDPTIIEQLIGKYSTQYQAIYLINLGIGSTYKPKLHSSSFMKEYAIHMELSQNDFIVVPIQYVMATDKYII